MATNRTVRRIGFVKSSNLATVRTALAKTDPAFSNTFSEHIRTKTLGTSYGVCDWAMTPEEWIEVQKVANITWHDEGDVGTEDRLKKAMDKANLELKPQ